MRFLLCKTFFAALGWAAVAFPQATLNLARNAGADPGPGIAACNEGAGWFSLFDGTGPSVVKYFFNPSGQRHGDNSRWWVTGNVLFSDQSTDRQGGVIFTKKQFKNVEFKTLVKPYYGNDGGYFFRSNTYGRSYQVVIDYLSGSTKAVGGVWGESGLHSINYKPFGFNSPTSITLRSEWYLNGSEGRQKLAAGDWGSKIWKANDFNWVHAKIYNNDVPWIDTWIGQNPAYQMVHYRDPATQAANETQIGHVGIQVHTGSGNWSINNPNQYRSILIREVQGSGAPLAAYPEWSQACPTGRRHATPRAAPSLTWRLHPGRLLEIDADVPGDYTLSLTDIGGRSLLRTRASPGARLPRVKVPASGVLFLDLRAGDYSQSYRIFQPGT